MSDSNLPTKPYIINKSRVAMCWTTSTCFKFKEKERQFINRIIGMINKHSRNVKQYPNHDIEYDLENETYLFKIPYKSIANNPKDALKVTLIVKSRKIRYSEPSFSLMEYINKTVYNEETKTIDVTMSKFVFDSISVHFSGLKTIDLSGEKIFKSLYSYKINCLLHKQSKTLVFNTKKIADILHPNGLDYNFTTNFKRIVIRALEELKKYDINWSAEIQKKESKNSYSNVTFKKI